MPENKYRLEKNSLQWILYVERDAKKKDGTPCRVSARLGFFPKFHQAVGRMYEEMVREQIAAPVEDLAAAVRKAEEIYKAIQAIEPVKEET